MSVYDSSDKLENQISLYAARGTLIESEGPSWFYGTGSEHTVMYQYQLYGAKNVSGQWTQILKSCTILIILHRYTLAILIRDPVLSASSNSTFAI